MESRTEEIWGYYSVGMNAPHLHKKLHEKKSKWYTNKKYKYTIKKLKCIIWTDLLKLHNLVNAIAYHVLLKIEKPQNCSVKLDIHLWPFRSKICWSKDTLEQRRKKKAWVPRRDELF